MVIILFRRNGLVSTAVLDKFKLTIALLHWHQQPISVIKTSSIILRTAVALQPHLQHISRWLSQVKKATIGEPAKSIRPRNSVESLEDGINEGLKGLGLGAT